ncbi:hypothetical protein PCANC_21196 [Puccinia coronata f. sp. avenae]|uniref:Pinin/SDK/MemA protein domain-containing protein n=3 Tax=Puccinia coronata f. sp. avenae TaxID=200324 RepID=A0A2N5S9H6_9BASI|nr:hypothetical protein PCASD_24813 [Puccinia coronata f. sp. avenae]PLW30447.1 hypothetical protein PCANC_21196 [Puccinia coronata f. sp. avenae]PLW40760.1 hypothetical protein PCASD_09308 [Puccinia coronata f. sp. avenae]
MDAHSPPAQPARNSAGPDDEIRAAEAEFTSKQGDADAASGRMMDESSGRPLDSADHQPRKKLKLTEADKKRSVRMFGALMGTLSKFQDETSKTKQTEAAKRRAAVESRLQAKLKLEAEALHMLRAYEVEETNLKQQVIRKTDELGHLSELHTIKFANRLACSHYLRTSTSKLTDADQKEPPLTTYGRPRHSEQPLFWLPHKLLPEQKEIIENQRREAQAEVAEDQIRWEEERLAKEEQLEKLQSHRDSRLAEIQAEKARARANADPTSDPTTANASLNPMTNDSPELGRRQTSEIRQDTPDVANDNGRDEDAVEY